MSDKILTAQSLVAWLESKDPKEQYDPTDCEKCLFFHFFRAIDPKAKPTPYAGSWVYTVNGTEIDAAEFMDVALMRGRTYGTALTKARELAA